MFRFTDLVIFRMTKACNISCEYCFMKDRPINTPDAYIQQDLLEAVIDNIAFQRILSQRTPYSLQLVLHGGEVLILGSERLQKILEYIRSTFTTHNIRYNLSIQTNGTLLTPDILNVLREYQVHVGMSFDGIEGLNDTRVPIKQQAWDEKFELLREHEVPFGFIMVASKQTAPQQAKSQRYLESLTKDETFGYKINMAEDMVTPGPDSPVELAGEDFFEYIYKPELQRFLRLGKTREVELQSIVNDTLIDLLAEHGTRRQTGCGAKSCGSALHMIAIEPDGDMDICDRFDRKYDDPMVHMMHALDYDFLGIHQIRRAIEFHTLNNKVIRETGCDWCRADYMCKHGCMTFHYSKYNQTWGIDKYIHCGIYQKTFDFIEEHLLDFLRVYADHSIFISNEDPIISLKEHAVQWAAEYGFTFSIENSEQYYNAIRVQRDASKGDIRYVNNHLMHTV